MKNTATIIRMLIRLVGGVLFILGVVYWAVQDPVLLYSLVLFHVIFGVVFSLMLLVQSLLAALKKVSIGLVILGFAWALALPAFGLTQSQIFPGPTHWVIRVVHLLVGLGAITLAEFLASQIIQKDEETPRRTQLRARSMGRYR